jgi:7-keto-8-aminopelargonate synthetase-like enzyme
VIPIIVGDSLKSVQLSQKLFQLGINVPFMIHPSVPQNGARLRFFVTCQHTEEQIRYTVETLAKEVAKL